MTVAERVARAWRVKDDEWIALVVAMAAFVVSGVVAAIVFGGREHPIDGRGSVGDVAAISGAVAAAVAFAASRLRPRDTAADATAGVIRFHWFDVAALAVAHGSIALLGWIGVATVLDKSFVDATVYATPGVLLVAAATALSAYAAFLSGSAMSPSRLSLVLAVFLVVGVLTAMLTSTDPHWWQMNLSALGITDDVSALVFNATLIVSGVIVTTIARFGTAGLPSGTAAERRRLVIVRVLFVLLGVLLGLVGVFPVDRFFLLHNTVATGMAVMFAALVFGLPWLIPGMSRVFTVLGFVFVAAIAGAAILFATGVYNLTAVELVAALLIFAWIILFLRNVQPSGAGERVAGAAPVEVAV